METIDIYQTNKKSRNIKGYTSRGKIVIRKKCLSVLMLSPLYFRRSLAVRLDGLKTMISLYVTGY